MDSGGPRGAFLGNYPHTRLWLPLPLKWRSYDKSASLFGDYRSKNKGKNNLNQWFSTWCRDPRGSRLNHYVVARRASTNHGSHYSPVSSNAETSVKANYLQLGGMINWLYAVMTIFA